MIKVYKENPKYHLALKISQKYYNSKKYAKATYWAKKANLLNHKDDKAWILFAKSEYASGHSKKAIKILNMYLAHANSSDGEALLLSWTQGN